MQKQKARKEGPLMIDDPRPIAAQAHAGGGVATRSPVVLEPPTGQTAGAALPPQMATIPHDVMEEIYIAGFVGNVSYGAPCFVGAEVGG